MTFSRFSAILFFLLIFAAGNLRAQDSQRDYFITINSDTVFCRIKSVAATFSKHKLIFKEENGKSNQIPLDSVKAYFMAKDTATYVLKDLPKKISGKQRVYVKWIERGRINLYEYESEIETKTVGGNGIVGGNSTVVASGQDRYFYIDKGTDTLVQIKTDGMHGTGSRKDRMKAFLSNVSDCPAVVTELKYTDLEHNYDFTVLRGLIKLYNEQCPTK